MARQKYVLPGNKRDEAIRWINNLHEKQPRLAASTERGQRACVVTQG